jgi:hypothetical protein
VSKNWRDDIEELIADGASVEAIVNFILKRRGPREIARVSLYLARTLMQQEKQDLLGRVQTAME